MFGSEVKRMISDVGLDQAADHYAEVIMQKIPDRPAFRQFILEELDAAQMGNDAALDFVAETGISPHEYMGAMRRSFPDVDGPGGPQQTLVGICMQIGSDVDQMVTLRVGIVRKILAKAPFGPFEEGAA